MTIIVFLVRHYLLKSVFEIILKKKLKILHIITNLPVGGAQDNTLLTVEKLDRKKFDVSLMCSSEGQWLNRALEIKDLNLFFIDALTRMIHLVNDIIAFWKIFRILKTEDFTIVHTHSSKPGFLGRIAAKMAGVPIIIHTIHGFPFNDFMNPFLRYLFIVIERILSNISDKLITVSKLNLDKAVKLKLAEPGKFVNVYSGIDFKKFETQVNIEAKRQEMGILNGEKVVGMVGRYSTQKAPLDFIKAIPVVLKERNDVRFVLVGDGELRHKLQKITKKLGIDSKILFLGFRDDIPELLYTFDVFVLTSLWEGLGRSLTEAMYTARPVVATNVEGVPELVQHEETGILVRPKDIHAIARGILNLLSNEQKAKQIGQAAKKRISQSFRVDVMVRDLENIYAQLIIEKKINY